MTAVPEWLGLANGYTIWVDRGKLYVRHVCGAEWGIPNGVDVTDVTYRIDRHTCADLLPHRPWKDLWQVIRHSVLLRAAGLAALFTLFSAYLVWFIFVVGRAGGR
jgi:hypothetical protein